MGTLIRTKIKLYQEQIKKGLAIIKDQKVIQMLYKNTPFFGFIMEYLCDSKT